MLNARFKPRGLVLRTMQGETKVASTAVCDLIVMDMNGENPIRLPKTYTRPMIPVDYGQIPKPETVAKWPHLREIADKLPAYNGVGSVDLLIGSNCPEAMVPLQVVTGDGNAPFAVRYKHGWTVI